MPNGLAHPTCTDTFVLRPQEKGFMHDERGTATATHQAASKPMLFLE